MFLWAVIHQEFSKIILLLKFSITELWENDKPLIYNMHLLIVETSFHNHDIYIPFQAIKSSTNLKKEYFGSETISFTRTKLLSSFICLASRKFVSTIVLTCITRRRCFVVISCYHWIVSTSVSQRRATRNMFLSRTRIK